MIRLVSMVLKHKQCLLYTRTAWQYGCHCGIAPKKCGGDEDGGNGGGNNDDGEGEEPPKDCLDSCCKMHTECFENLQVSNVVGVFIEKTKAKNKID